MQSDHAGIAAKRRTTFLAFLGAIYQRKASCTAPCHDDPGQAPQAPLVPARGAHPGSQAQRSDCTEVCVWPASPAQPLLPLHHHILLLLQALVVPTPTA